MMLHCLKKASRIDAGHVILQECKEKFTKYSNPLIICQCKPLQIIYCNSVSITKCDSATLEIVMEEMDEVYGSRKIPPPVRSTVEE